MRTISVIVSLLVTAPVSVTQKELPMWMTVGERRIAVTLTDSAAARALAVQLPLTLVMSELNGNKKRTSFPRHCPPPRADREQSAMVM